MFFQKKCSLEKMSLLDELTVGQNRLRKAVQADNISAASNIGFSNTKISLCLLPFRNNIAV